MTTLPRFVITAAIPTYKRPREFQRALESVLAQSVQPDFIVVGDDASQEEICNIVELHKDDRITYVPRQSKINMTDNWDFVMRWAETGLVALLEDDNIWEPDHLELATSLYAKYPNEGIYHAGHKEAHDYDGKLEIYREYLPPWHAALAPRGGGVVPAKDVVFDALLGGSINASTVVVACDILKQMPRFDHRYVMGMDTLMWSRIAMSAPCIYGPAYDTIYTYHGHNASTNEIRSRRAGSQVRASRRLLLAEALEQGVVTLEDLKEFLADLSDKSIGGVLTMLAHGSVEPDVRMVVRDAWKRRKSARNSTGYMRMSRFFGFPSLAHVDRIDKVLALWNKIK